MPTCRACGASSPDDARFCPTCGNALPAGAPGIPAQPLPDAPPLNWPAPAPPTLPPGPGPRPLGVLLVALWNLGIGALVALFGLFFVALAPMFFEDPAMRQEMERQVAGQFPMELLSGAFLFLGLFAVLFGVAMVVVGWGLYQGRGWAWTGMVALVLVNAAFNVLTLPMGLVGLLVNGFLLWYFFQPGVRRYFGKEAQPPQPGLPGYVPPPS